MHHTCTALMDLDRVLHEANTPNHIEHQRTHRTGIHPHRASNASWNALQELHPGQSMLSSFNRYGLELRARSAVKMLTIDIDPAKVRMRQTNHNASNAPVPNQQIRDQAKHRTRTASLPA